VSGLIKCLKGEEKSFLRGVQIFQAISSSFILHPKPFPRGVRKFPVHPIYGHAFFYSYVFYLTANDGRPEPGVPSAGTSCDNMTVKSQHIEAKKDPLMNQ